MEERLVALQVKAAEFATTVDAGEDDGTALGDDWLDDALGLATEPTGKAPVGWGRFALIANMTPMATAAAKTAATPTIRYGRLRSAVDENNVFMPVRCMARQVWLHNIKETEGTGKLMALARQAR